MLSKVIEAEVRYAVRNEYAQTAVDVLARRTRLSFLNVQATLDALPRVVDIMAEELKWSRSRKKQEIDRAIKFLGTMGLPPGADLALKNKSLLTRAENTLWRAIGYDTVDDSKKIKGPVLTRAQFASGEIDALKAAFARRVVQPAGPAEAEKIGKEVLVDTIKEVPGYEGIRTKDYDYVLLEAGFSDQSQLDFDEFLEVRQPFFFDATHLTDDFLDMRYSQGSVICAFAQEERRKTENTC